MNERRHVLIAIPSFTGIMTTNIGRMLGLSQQLNATEGHPFRYSYLTAEGIKGYALVRNNIAQQFLASDCEILWMIDDDIAPEADAFGLLLHDVDIVAPMMPILSYDYNLKTKRLVFTEEFAAFRFGDLDDMGTREYAKPKANSGLIQVDAVGTGCTVVHRRVLADKRMCESRDYLRPDGKPYTLQSTDPPPIFHTRTMPNGAVSLGEDVDFCVRARRLGYRVGLDTDIEVGHKKMLDILPLLMIKRHLEELNTSVASEVARP